MLIPKNQQLLMLKEKSMNKAQVALDSSATTFQMFQFSNDWKFTESCKESMKDDLDALREMLTQMKGVEKGGKRDFDDWYFHVSRIAMAAMQMYLSGKLDEVKCDEK